MRAIRLMADYDCFPLWEAAGNAVGNIDPDSLPISAELKARLQDWADTYDRTLDRDDPTVSGFATPEEEQRFAEEGRALRDALASELGPDIPVTLQV